MIEVNHQNTNKYFKEEIVDEIFNFIHQEINNNISILPTTGLGCMCFPEVPIKKLGKRNVYVEYHYKVIGSPNQVPIPLEVKPHSVIIFEGMPQEINDKIEHVKKLISEYAQSN